MDNPTEKQTKYFAVFGDVHGHLRLMFELCRLWQLQHEIHLDGILQCGDLGYFPNMGILHWNGPDDHFFEIVDEQWMQDVTFMKWQNLSYIDAGECLFQSSRRYVPERSPSAWPRHQ